MAKVKTPVHYGRFYILVGLIFAGWLLIELNLFRFQIVEHKRLDEYARGQYEREIMLDAQRGTIFDRSGNKLATNVIYYDIAADPKVVKNKTYIAKTLSQSFSKSRNHYLAKMNRNSRFAYLERKTRGSKIKTLKDFKDPGLRVIENFGRHYPYGSYAGQLLGFTWLFNDISKQKDAERQMLQQNELLLSLMDTMPDSIYFKDAENRFVLVNKAKALHWGCSPRTFLPATISQCSWVRPRTVLDDWRRITSPAP